MPAAQSGSRFVGGDKHVAALAEWQLEKWREYMRTNFRISLAVREEYWALICAWCNTVIIRLTDEDGHFYSWEFGQFEAACVAHLRNNHREIEASVYNG